MLTSLWIILNSFIWKNAIINWYCRKALDYEDESESNENDIKEPEPIQPTIMDNCDTTEPLPSTTLHNKSVDLLNMNTNINTNNDYNIFNINESPKQSDQLLNKLKLNIQSLTQLSPHQPNVNINMLSPPQVEIDPSDVDTQSIERLDVFPAFDIHKKYLKLLLYLGINHVKGAQYYKNNNKENSDDDDNDDDKLQILPTLTNMPTQALSTAIEIPKNNNNNKINDFDDFYIYCTTNINKEIDNDSINDNNNNNNNTNTIIDQLHYMILELFVLLYILYYYISCTVIYFVLLYILYYYIFCTIIYFVLLYI